MVAVPKPNGNTHICLDYTQLNKVVDPCSQWMKVSPSLQAANSSGKLPSPNTQKPLTWSITPCGRFTFNRPPFGPSSASLLPKDSVANSGRPARDCMSHGRYLGTPTRKENRTIWKEQWEEREIMAEHLNLKREMWYETLAFTDH